MKFTFAHNNINVNNMEESIAWYEKAFGLTVSRRRVADDGSFEIVYLTDGVTPHLLELTWMQEYDRPYDLGDNEIHLAMAVDDYEAARKLHEEMGCICFVNPKMGIYFCEDPTGYWVEVVHAKK